jgi:catabolite regulation protein CreA
MLAGLAASPGRATDEPDLTFRRSTVFKWLTPNDKLLTCGLDDPEVVGVACHFTVGISRCICGSHATRIAIGSAALRDDIPPTDTSCLRAIQSKE